MAFDPNLFIHPSDRAAMKALQAIPGFQALMKAFMSIWDERKFKIENMSSKLRVSERQMKKYYDMLPPICEKLGIKVPEMYIELDVVPNAYTYGDTEPFVVVTSGLLERFPDDLVQTVIAHECGHIACHHTLYGTMGRMILNGTSVLGNFLTAGNLITEPLLLAYFYWMRCSEFSADRAAIVFDGTADKLTRMCMCFAGYDPRFSEEADVDVFMEQAKEYVDTMKDSKVNKLIEFYMYRTITHPLTAVRAYEGKRWFETEHAGKVIDYAEAITKELPQSIMLPVPASSKKLLGQNYEKVRKMFVDTGFTNVKLFEEPSKERMKRSGSVVAVCINTKFNFAETEWFPSDSMISIHYKE